MSQHVAYSPEGTFGSWQTPAKFLHVDSCSIQAARENVKLQQTGIGRGRYMSIPGAKPVNGSLALPWWQSGVLPFFQSVLKTQHIQTVSTGIYDHGLAFNDAVANGSFSIQQQFGGSVNLNILGAVCKAFKITAAAKSQAQLNFDFEAKDEAPAGGTWDYNGAASPAVVTPVVYTSPVRPLMFYDCEVKLGGTCSYSGSTGKITVSGGAATKLIGTVDISVDLGLDSEAYALATPDPTRQWFYPGNRAIAITLDVLWLTRDLTFYNAMRAASKVTLELNIAGAIIGSTYKQEAHICIPHWVIDTAKLPDIASDETPKRQAVSGEAILEATTGMDFGMWIRTTEAT